MLKEYKGKTIRVREVDRYVSATDMAQATNKLFGNWNRLDSTQEFLEVLSAVIHIRITELIEVHQGGTPTEQGTWLHPKVAIQFAMWCSPAFAVQVSNWIDELLTTGKVELQSEPTLCLLDDPQALAITINEASLGICRLENFGHLQIAQLAANAFGNSLYRLQSTNSHSDSAIASLKELDEGVIDVAMRLGYKVPSNYESSLGRYVKDRCQHLVKEVQNKRYSNSSGKAMMVNMYPAHNLEVEQAVVDYAVQKGFKSE